MKKFKIEYGIVREYDEVTLWFEPIDDDLDALVLRNRSGEILSVFTEQRKKGREGSDQKWADAIGLLETARSGRGGNAELPWRAGVARQGRGGAVWHHLPHGSGRQPPAGPELSWGTWVATKRGERRRMYPHGSGWTPDRPGAARAEMRSCRRRPLKTQPLPISP